MVPSGSELIEDVRKATDDFLSHSEPFKEVRNTRMPHAACPTPRSPITDESGRLKLTQTDYTLKRLNLDDNYHKGVVRSKLTRNVVATFEKVHDELPAAVRDSIPTVGEGILSCTLTTRWLYVQRVQVGSRYLRCRPYNV